MRKYTNVRMDARALSMWVWLAIVAVIIILVAVAFYAMAEPPPNMNKPTEDTEYVLSIKFNFKYRNLPGGWIAPERDRTFEVSWVDYDKDDEYSDNIFTESIFELMFLDEDEHRFTLTIEVSSPQEALIAKESWKQDIHIGEMSKIEVSFGTKYCYIDDPGTYTVKVVLHVYAPEEAVLTGPIPGITQRKVDDTIWTLSKNIKVGD